MISEERWLTAGLEALEGEVLLLEAAIHLQQAHDLRSHLQALTAAARAGVKEIDLDATENNLEDARFAAAEAAFSAAEKFNHAIRSDPQWVYQANLAAALAMLAGIDPTNDDYRLKATETLRACLQGRDDIALTGWARVCTDRLNALLTGLERSPDDQPGADDEPEADS